MNFFSAQSVLDQLRQALNVKSDSDLSRVLGVKRATLANWKTRDAIPYAICVTVALEKGISLQWLLIGKGEMLSNDNDRSTHTQLIELYDTLTADQQKEVVQFICEKKRIAALEEAVQQLQKTISHLQT